MRRGGQSLITADRERLFLQAEAVWIDVRQMLAATIDDPRALWAGAGELLEEFDGLDPALDRCVMHERGRLRAHALGVLGPLFDTRSPAEDVVPLARQLLRFDSTHEGAWRSLMQAHADQGERVAAFDAYSRCRSALQAGRGAVPDEETERLFARIKSGEAVSARKVPYRGQGHAQVEGFQGFRPIIVAVQPLGVRGEGADASQSGEQLGQALSSALLKFVNRRLVSIASATDSRDSGPLPHGAAGPDYIVEGSLHAANGSQRANVRLVKRGDGEFIAWAGQFAMVPGHSDAWAQQVAARLDQQLGWEESKRATRLSVEECSAEDLVYRAWPFMLRLGSPDFAAAEPLLRRALALDPCFAPAHFHLAFNLCVQIAQGTVEDLGRVVSDARYHAARAMSLAPDNAKALAVAGHVRAFLDHKPAEGLELQEQAIRLNPGLPMAWGFSAGACTFLGRTAEARSRLARYRQAEIEDQNGIMFECLVVVLELGARDISAAVEAGRRTIALVPQFAAGLRYHLAALGHAGLVEEALYVRERLLQVQPDLTIALAIAQTPLRVDADRDYLAEGLRLAGLAEGAAPLRASSMNAPARSSVDAGVLGSEPEGDVEWAMRAS